jgi:hypothetical protein
VLKFEAERQPGRLGSSVLGYNDAFAKLHPVLRQWRAKRAGCGRTAPVPYIVSADVSRAFDHVNADKLIDIVEPMLRSQEYLIIKHVEVRNALLSQIWVISMVSLQIGLEVSLHIQTFSDPKMSLSALLCLMRISLSCMQTLSD